MTSFNQLEWLFLHSHDTLKFVYNFGLMLSPHRLSQIPSFVFQFSNVGKHFSLRRHLLAVDRHNLFHPPQRLRPRDSGNQVSVQAVRHLGNLVINSMAAKLGGKGIWGRSSSILRYANFLAL